MALTPSEEALLARLNEKARADHIEASEKAERAGKPVPPAPTPLTPEQIEYPKWVYKGWKESKKGNGHQEPTESRLIKNAEEHKTLGDGWTEEPPKPQAQAKK